MTAKFFETCFSSTLTREADMLSFITFKGLCDCVYTQTSSKHSAKSRKFPTFSACKKEHSRFLFVTHDVEALPPCQALPPAALVAKPWQRYEMFVKLTKEKCTFFGCERKKFKIIRPVSLKNTFYAAFGYVISLFPPLSQ